MKIKSFNTLILSLLFSSFSQAEVSLDFKGLFPNKIMKSFLSSVNGSYQDKNIKFSFNADEFVPGLEVESFLFDYNLDLEMSLDSQSGDIGGYFVFPSAVLKAKKVDLLYETESIVGGVKIKLKTKLQCDLAYLNMASVSGFIRGALSIEKGEFIFDKSRAQMELGDLSNSLSIDLEGCSGAKGLEPVIKEELLAWISSKEGKSGLLNIVIDAVVGFINEKLSEFQNVGYKAPFVNKMVRLKIESGFLKAEGFEFKGQVFFDHKEDKHFSLKERVLSREEKGVFKLPKEFAKTILPMFLKSSDKVSINFDRKGLPQADFLFNNRFVQFFVWADLLNFKKSSDFNLDINLNPKQVLLMKQSSKSLGFHFYGKHQSDFDFKNSNNRIFPYMNFNGELSSSINVNINKSGFDIKLSKFGINSNCLFDELMMTWRKTQIGSKPWMSMILNQVSKALGRLNYSWSWSDLGLSLFDFKSVKINHADSDFAIEFDL